MTEHDNSIETNRCLVGDVRSVLPTLPAGIVHCAVTSPPFWGLRDYGHTDQLGMEAEPDCLGWATGAACGVCYVCTLVGVCREIRRVLRADGTFWMEIGDTYAAARSSYQVPDQKAGDVGNTKGMRIPKGLKPKDLGGIPWRVALALQADGWYLRCDIVWARPNPMPESVRDRPTKAHSYLFLLTTSEMYYYDAEAIREQASNGSGTCTDPSKVPPPPPGDPPHRGLRAPVGPEAGRNTRSVWTIASQPYSGAHFAVWPPTLVRRCILAGTSEAGCCAACGAPRQRTLERTSMVVRSGPGRAAKQAANGALARTALGGTVERPASSRTTGWQATCDCDVPSVPCLVLDPFMGSGTTAQVAESLGRRWLGVEVNPAYIALQRERTAQASLTLLERVQR